MPTGSSPTSCCPTRMPNRTISTRHWPHPLGSAEATATMSRTHAEIHRLTDRIGNHLELARNAGAVQFDQLDDLRACLYGLHALLRLHFLQEEENYFTLTDAEDPGGAKRTADQIPPTR